MRCSWFRAHGRQLHLDCHLPEFPPTAFKNFDARAFVDQLEKGRVNLVALFAKCHFGNSYYNTKAGHKHQRLPQDLLMETACECRMRGIKTLAYYSLCWDKRAWDENPAWRFIDAEGRTFGEDRPWGTLCMNTPYKDELVIPQLAEIAIGYPVDGFFLDIPMPYIGDNLCFCAFCRRRWKVEYDIDLTPSLPRDLRARLAMRTLVSYLQEIRDLIASTDPALVICMNDVGTSEVSLPVKELCEIGVWEAQPRPGDYLGQSYAARVARNDILDSQVMTVRFYQSWGDMTLKPTPQLTTEFAAMIGNGVVASAGDQVNVDGTLQAPVYDAFSQAFGFVADREEVLAGAESVRHAVVLLPVPDPELPLGFALGEARTGQQGPAPWRGAHQLLVESHIQVDLLYSVLAEDLHRFPILILPEPGAYQPGMHERLRRYVADGGTLVAVGKSLLQGGQFHLEDVFGIRYLEPLSFDIAHFLPAEEVRGETAEIPLQVRGQVYKVRREGAQELAALIYPVAQHQPPGRAFRSPPPPDDARSPFSFATLHRYGEGQAIYIAASLFEIYWRTHHHWLRQFVEAVLRYADPTLPYEIEASGRVEANLMRKGSDLLLNLIHYAPGHQGRPGAIAGIERVDPLRDIACAVRCRKPERVVCEPQGQKLPFSYEEGICRFVVPELEYLAIVRICEG